MIRLSFTIACLLALFIAPSEAQVYASPQSPTPQVVAAPAVQYVPVVPVADPYGFLSWLNSFRAQNGRAAVCYDSNLSAWAAQNNSQQHRRGMGHFVMGPARRQNSGYGPGSTVWHMWTLSPSHRSALLDPSITRIGIAASGIYWTFDAN